MLRYLLPLLSVLVGYAAALALKPTKKKHFKLLLAFSGSFLLSITVLHLLPDVYAAHGHENHDHLSTGIWIMGGILLQIVLEFFSRGAEHGHVHVHDDVHTMPWSLFISLCLHAFLEGFPVSRHEHLALGIAIHHLPIAMILTVFFLNAKLNRTALLLFMIAFALMTPLGTWAASTLPVLADSYEILTAVVIGVLFHISSTIIFESSEGHRFNVAKVSVIVLGIVLACLV